MHARGLALKIGLFVLLAVGVQLAAGAAGKTFYLTQLTMSAYYALVVLSLCLLMGYAGQVSLGHGAFFALGGYTSAVLTTLDLTRFKSAAWAAWGLQWHALVTRENTLGDSIVTVAPTAAFLAAMLLTFIVATFIGYPALRLKGHYLAMATLGFGLIVSKIILAFSFTGAADGITGVPEWRWFGGLSIGGDSSARVSNYYLACGILLVCLIALENLIHSRVGRALQAIHDRESAASAMGINTAAYKLKTFVASALLAALAGVLLTHYTGGIGPSEASALKSVRHVALAATGGMSSLWSAAGASSTINFLSLRGLFGSFDQAVFGALLIVIVSVAPEGPFQPLGQWIRGLFRRSAPPKKEAHGPA